MRGIYTKKRFYHTQNFRLRAFVGGMFLLLLIAFGREIGSIWSFFFSFTKFLFLGADSRPFNADLFRNISIVTVQLIVLGVTFFLFLLLVSQFVLPVHTSIERQKVFERLWLYLTRMHGAAIFVKEGKVIGRRDEMLVKKPGVALVDLSSAIILESLEPPENLVRIKKQNKVRLSELLSGSRIKSGARVYGPGIVFTNYNEMVRGAADLRPQVRINPNVHAHTRDGIEVSTHIFTVFTLGQPADAITVGYEGGISSDNLRVVYFSELPQSGSQTGATNSHYFVINKLSDELSPEEKEEIYKFIQSYNPQVNQIPLSDVETSKEKPYLCDSGRVFEAIYSQAKDVYRDRYMDWTELPAYVATEVFRNMLAQVTYEYLYQPLEDEKYPLKDLKNNFARRVANLGVLSYQFMWCIDGTPFCQGQVIHEENVYKYPVRDFQQPKVLRSRGIKVIRAGFTELKPVNEMVHNTLFENWKAGWERDADATKADYDLQAMRVRIQARAQAQNDLAFTLSRILKTASQSDEAVALRVFQALELTATDPTTQKLLPGEIIDMIRTLRHWLLPDDDIYPPMLGNP